eukprot:2023689-Rhodomonas_salina.1
MSGTEVVPYTSRCYGPCAISGTDSEYRCTGQAMHAVLRSCVWCYALAIRCPVLRERMMLPAAATGPTSGRAGGMSLRGWYAVCGTERAYGMRCAVLRERM